jgi:hypothetical protein
LINRLRVQLFLWVLFMAVPFVILSQGGSALQICFNTLAVLFLAEVDNMTYNLGMSERTREKVDEKGHVLLTDAEAARLSRAKTVCIVATVVLVTCSVITRSMGSAILWGWLAALIFQLSRMDTTSPKGVALSVLQATGIHILCFVAFFVFHEVFFNQ